jgi:NAD(P)-dependent dehydrogenase (short-subunit alcohol dehydrogenase family)
LRRLARAKADAVTLRDSSGSGPGRRDGKTIVVTGAAMGMGRAVAERCGRAGARVFAVDRDPAVLDLAADWLVPFVGDVADNEFSVDVCRQASTTGSLNGLVNVAALHARGSAVDVSLELWQRALDVNVTGVMLWCRAALPWMVTAGGGSIVNFGSVLSQHAQSDVMPYVVTKTAVLGITRSIAVDFAAQGIRCNTLSPGTVDTPMLRKSMADTGRSVSSVLENLPMGRMGHSDEIAGLCEFLLSDDSTYVNGAEVVADGARSARL